MAKKPTPKAGITSSASIPPYLVASSAQLSDPGFTKTEGSVIPDLDSTAFNTSINALRNLPPAQAIRILTRIDGTFSAALNSYLQLSMSSGFKVTGYMSGTHQFDSNGTLAAMAVMTSMTTLFDYTEGFSERQSIEGLVETLIKEVLQTGGCMGELVFNKWRIPDRIVSIPLTSIDWVSKKDGTYFPRQRPSTGDYIPLDIPTVFYAASGKQSNSLFPRSMFESGLNMTYRYQELIEDIFKVLRRAGHSRTVVKILQEAVQKAAPSDVRSDPAKLQAFLENTRKAIETSLTKLNPDDAIVHYDSAEVSNLATKGEKGDYSAILETMSGMLASSLKSMPSMLGMRLGGSQSLSNTESLTFLKMVEGIRRPVETVMSRALTLAVRVSTGMDVYVGFKFNPVELRPEAELSAHRSVEQQRVMRMLSMGYYSDDEAAHILGAFPRASGAPDLSGTMFMDKATASPSEPDATSTVNEGAQQKVLTPPTPASGGGNPKG